MNNPTASDAAPAERAAFEAWHAENRPQSLERFGHTYKNVHVRDRWQGWQARAALSNAPTIKPSLPVAASTPASGVAEREAFEQSFQADWTDPAMSEQRAIWTLAWAAARASTPVAAEPSAYPPLPESDASTFGLGEVWNRHSMRAYVDADRLSRAAPVAAEPMTRTLLTEDHVSLITALAECRDAFPMPEPGSPLEVAWGAAMGDPESVPEYVKACLAAAPSVPPAEASEPVVFDDYPTYNREAMGCGLEDRNIRDRYDAMEYGWNEAMERVAERIDGFLSELPLAALPAPVSSQPTGWQPIETAPKTSNARLVWCPARQNMYVVTWDGREWRHFDTGSWPLNEEPTHWMPLPAAPAPKEAT